MNRSKRISVWGATGSIGTQTLDFIGRYPDRFQAVTLTCHTRVDLLLEQAERFHPETVVLTGSPGTPGWERSFRSCGARLLLGKEGLLEAAGSGKEDLVVNALVGSVGLEATLRAVRAGVSIALANKEVLVMAGELVMSEIARAGVSLFPIDSEHSAVFQCLQGERMETVRRILLTASGGPFRDWKVADLPRATVEQALAHPNWSMGKKVTVDSATLMNKGLEVIEARWLFGMDPDRVSVVIHPQSIIHSMVEFADGSVKAQMGVPDMRIPIAYALTYPDRWNAGAAGLDFFACDRLTFLSPDREKYPALDLAYEALRKGGTAPAVLNAADEVAVDLFLSKRIPFTRIAELIRSVLHGHEPVPRPDLDSILAADRWARDTLSHDTIHRS